MGGTAQPFYSQVPGRDDRRQTNPEAVNPQQSLEIRSSQHLLPPLYIRHILRRQRMAEAMYKQHCTVLCSFVMDYMVYTSVIAV